MVVAILCAVEPIVGFELSESVVRAGGYTSIDNALGQLLPRLEKEWTKKKRSEIMTELAVHQDNDDEARAGSWAIGYVKLASISASSRKK